MSSIPLDRLQVEIADQIIGHGTPVLLETIKGLGVGALRAKDYEVPGGDGTEFGREYRAGQEIEFVGEIVMPGDEAGAWQRSAQLAAVFDAADLRKTPRAVMPIRFNRPGADTRLLYGRPDEYDPDVTRAVIGLIEWSGTFRLAHPAAFSDLEHALTLSLSATSAGGLVTDEDGNIPSPITTIAGTRRTSIIENAGDADAWGVYTIDGPITDPSVSLIDAEGGRLWRLGYDGALAFDQSIVIDTRPWSRGAHLASGSSLPGKLTRDSAPSLSPIPPGTWEVVVDGADMTGTASFDIRWRDAFRAL